VRAPRRRTIPVLVAQALVIGTLVTGPSFATVGPYSGGPTDFVETSQGQIAVSVVLPKDYDPAKTYPSILEMAGYENGSASADGRTMLGTTRDVLCAQSPDPRYCPPDPPLAEDSQALTASSHFTDDGYVVVHANLPGTGCSSGEFGLYSFQAALAGYEIIENWMPTQPWWNGEAGILGHSWSGMTGFFIAAQEGLAASEGRPHHLVAMTISGLVDDVYRGITYPGGVFNTLFPPLWYLGIRNAYSVAGGTAQGVARNADNDNGKQCAVNSATHTLSTDDDPIVQGLVSQGLDNDYWRSHSLISYADLIDVPTHITGTFNDEQTGARGFSHLWDAISVPKRLLMVNGDHDTNVKARETWADRKTWMDYWMRDIAPDSSWGWSPTQPTSVRALLELHKDDDGNLVSNGHIDSTSYPFDQTTWTDYYLCGGKALTTDRATCGVGSDTYLSGTRRQSWNYQFGYDQNPPLTTADGPDQVRLQGPVVEEGNTWAIAGPIVADLYLSASGNDTDLFVQIADEDTASKSISFLQRGWLKASHRAIDPAKSDYTSVDPARANFLYRPWRPHVDPVAIQPGVPENYFVEVWPVAHVFRPGHRLVVIVTAPPAVDSDYAFAVQTSQPVSVNTLIYNDESHPSRVTLPVVPATDVTGLGATGPGCPGYWQVRCAGE